MARGNKKAAWWSNNSEQGVISGSSGEWGPRPKEVEKQLYAIETPGGLGGKGSMSVTYPLLQCHWGNCQMKGHWRGVEEVGA